MLHSITLLKNMTICLNYQFEGHGQGQKLPKNERFSHIFKSISPLFDVVWFLYVFFTYATTMPFKLK